MGSSGGGYNSVTSSEPWEGQAKFLTPIFQSALYGSAGATVNSGYDPNDPNNNTPKFSFGNEALPIAQNFFNPGATADVPGQLKYFGAEDTMKEDRNWAPEEIIIPRYADTDYGARNVAEFTTPQTLRSEERR